MPEAACGVFSLVVLCVFPVSLLQEVVNEAEFDLHRHWGSKYMSVQVANVVERCSVGEHI